MKEFRKLLVLSKNNVPLPNDTFCQCAFTKLGRLSFANLNYRQIMSRQNVDPKRVWCNNIGYRSLTTLSNGRVAHQPTSYGVGDLIKVILTCTAGLTVGAWISKSMVSILEEYELFAPEEEEEDEDDDD